MSTILFHPSRLVHDLGLHNARPVDRAAIESGASQNIVALQEAESIVPDLQRVVVRPAADRRRRVEMQQSA